MKYIECPTEFNYLANPDQFTIFMGGGITNCPDWQRDMCDRLSDLDITLVNPRRDFYDLKDPNAANQQIHWEHRNLSQCDAIMFWFPKETLCPITLLELGKYMMTDTPLFVGCHPDYQRVLDVKIQLSIERPDVFVGKSLGNLEYEIRSFLQERNR